MKIEIIKIYNHDQCSTVTISITAQEADWWDRQAANHQWILKGRYNLQE